MMDVNYDRVCRLCLSSQGELLPIFPTTSSDETEPPTLVSKIKDCVAVQINENDALPTNVCKKCLHNVNNWHKFKTVCEKAQIKLQSLDKKDGSQLEEVHIKSEPFSDEAYDDGVLIDGSYPENEDVGHKLQPEGPPILASLGLTPRSDKGVESEKEEETLQEEAEEAEEIPERRKTRLSSKPEVSITVMRPSGETLHARQPIHQLASKDCLVCNRSYRYSHNARRHELSAHNFDRYTNKVAPKKSHSHSHMQPKLRPNPFNPKSRLMPNPISHKIQLFPKHLQPKIIHPKIVPPKPIPIKNSSSITPQNILPYPLRIKALKDLQIKKKEPEILKTLLTSKPEILVSEPEILNSGPESPETLISEPEIASFQVETILSEPDNFENQHDDDDDIETNNQPYDEDMGSENDAEINTQQEDAAEQNGENEAEDEIDHDDENPEEVKNNYESDEKEASQDVPDHLSNDGEEKNQDAEGDSFDENKEELDDHDADIQNEDMQDDNEADEDLPPIAPVVEISEEMAQSLNETNDDEHELDITVDPDGTVDPNDVVDVETVKESDTEKQCVTKAQRDFIAKNRNIIEQINTKTCLCCNREYPRRKAVIQHLQKNGHKVPKHTCYNCVVTFGHIGALLSHMRSNSCTDLWKIIYNENGITDDLVLEEEPKNKIQHKDIVNARSYACKLCPAKFQLKQFITKHVLDNHEDGQSMYHTACVHCGTRFKDRAILKRHIRNCDCTVYIACDLCPETFGNLLEFNEHALQVHASSFDQSDNLSKCVDGRPTDCPLCGKKNSTYPNLVKHLKIYHDEDRPHYCKHCDSKFEQAADLNKHIYVEHNSQGMPNNEPNMSLVKEEAEEYHYSCTECNAIFETVDAWTDHQVAEHNQIAHHCDQCEKKFLRPSELAEHKNTHLRVKFYPCNTCKNSYSSPQKLTEHVQQCHAVATPAADEFFCNICVRAFKSRQAYSNHMRIHSKVPTSNKKPDQKSFAPHIVGKPIKQFPIMQPSVVFKPNWNVPNAPYSCDICGKGFMHKKNIWKHKKVLHADLLNDRHDSEDNTMHASTEEDEYNVDENGTGLTTPQFDSFNFANIQQSQESLPYSCEICFKRFPLRTSLWKHKRALHGISENTASTSSNQQQNDTASRSSCTICKISFADKKSYYRHRKNVHKTAVQMCKICGKPLNSTLELYEHLKAAHARELLGYNANQVTAKQEPVHEELDYEGDQDSIDPSADYQARYPCDTCGKQFVGLLALQNHQCINQVSSQHQTFDCEICHKSYTSIAALKSHRGWHLRSPDGKAAANNTALWMPQAKVTNKISKHEVLDPSQLAKVTHVAPTPSTPASVAKRRLPPEVEVTVVNPNKKMRSDDSVEFEQHSNMSGGTDGRYCNVCDKEFTKRAAYQRHMDEVHQPNSFFCPVCSKSFTRKSTLIIHMKKHYNEGEGQSSQMDDDGEGIVGCDICEAQFDSDEALLNHRITEHGDESEESGDEGDGAFTPAPPGEFTCGQCGDGVATPRDLLAHRTMHSTPTKFFCNICKVYFARALDLSSHTRARHSESDKFVVHFPCAMCSRSYMNKKSLQRHIDMCH